MKNSILALTLMFACLGAQARVEVLFHPHDPTLETIAQWIAEAQSQVDIAMYNMDATPNSPVIQTLQSPQIQDRLKSGALKIRLLLELYGSPEDNSKKRQAMEDLGVDVRFLGKAVKAHHKFAVIDTLGPVNRVITGSANWSLGSYRSYNENILFFTQEPEASARYQREFNLLWNNAKEFGSSKSYEDIKPDENVDQNDLDIYFNSAKKIDSRSTEPSNLTQEVVRLIDGAKSNLQIATTRIRLAPILEALLRAAERGVSIQAVISQDDFSDIFKRSKYLLGHPNIDLRIKFYNLKVRDYLAFQMHNKFMIIDGQAIVTGSFNWSVSSENKHIENIAILSGQMAQEVLPQFTNEFQNIFSLGRSEYYNLLKSLQAGQYKECAITPMSLHPYEIKNLLKLSSHCK